MPSGAVTEQPALDVPERLRHAREERDAGRLEEAEASCRAAVAAAPRNSEAHRLLGTVLRLQDRGRAAVESLRRAAELDPESAKALRHLAIALAEEGDLDGAMECDRRALALQPRYLSALCHLARLKRFEPGDPDLAVLEEIASDAASLDAPKQVLLFFALAKAYEDIGNYPRSFDCLNRGNRLKRVSLEYDVEKDLELFREIAGTFDAELLGRLTGAGSQSELPIVIVGMPRSGTTLVEQILASHPAVHGGGELSDLDVLSVSVSFLNEKRLGFPKGVRDLGPDDLTRLGHGYVARLGRIAEGAARVTDKNPTNFCYLGLVRLIVPRARVIHCVRDPLDTCMSCYSLLFNNVEFAYDLVELGRYYRGYVKLMDHWRSVLPADWIVDIRYEDLVDDIEREARRIVAHCGLGWEDRCLEFHDAPRAVRTASFAQVRQPLYRDSIGRARRYEPYLRPLVDALEAES